MEQEVGICPPHDAQITNSYAVREPERWRLGHHHHPPLRTKRKWPSGCHTHTHGQWVGVNKPTNRVTSGVNSRAWNTEEKTPAERQWITQTEREILIQPWEKGISLNPCPKWFTNKAVTAPTHSRYTFRPRTIITVYTSSTQHPLTLHPVTGRGADSSLWF